MSVVSILERARKAAGISGMTKNYPDNPKHRGCGYWAAFIGSLRNDLEQIADDKLKDQRDVAEANARIAELESEKGKAKDRAVINGVRAIGADHEWTPDQRKLAETTIAG